MGTKSEVGLGLFLIAIIPVHDQGLGPIASYCVLLPPPLKKAFCNCDLFQAFDLKDPTAWALMT